MEHTLVWDLTKLFHISMVHGYEGGWPPGQGRAEWGRVTTRDGQNGGGWPPGQGRTGEGDQQGRTGEGGHQGRAERGRVATRAGQNGGG